MSAAANLSFQSKTLLRQDCCWCSGCCFLFFPNAFVAADAVVAVGVVVAVAGVAVVAVGAVGDVAVVLLAIAARQLLT